MGSCKVEIYTEDVPGKMESIKRMLHLYGINGHTIFKSMGCYGGVDEPALIITILLSGDERTKKLGELNRFARELKRELSQQQVLVAITETEMLWA